MPAGRHVFASRPSSMPCGGTSLRPPWAGIVDQTRAINWSEGHQGIAGGPPMRTTICATLRPGATAAQISKAIASCGANQVVFLEAGTYLLSSGLSFGNKSRVTLRGAGPDRTILKFADAEPCGGFAADIGGR